MFFSQINTFIDWNTIEKVIDADYSKRESAVGKPSYSGLLLFKMCILESWYRLSDYEVEDRLNDSVSFSYFCSMNSDKVAPDHSTLSRFRTALTQTKTFEKLCSSLNAQLEVHNIIVKKRIIVDASVIDTPLQPKGKSNHKVTEDRTEKVIVVK
ncbi:transposase [Formosa sp. PL04]|uniref:transposase n=1 Tax=Formosa sp. PL04 TaxID=3081755 RepID=UPI002982B0BD|nr:transposase [Formosa sp. PL04]MDW5288896.1 transposase [Formosa sp. PL04]